MGVTLEKKFFAVVASVSSVFLFLLMLYSSANFRLDNTTSFHSAQLENKKVNYQLIEITEETSNHGDYSTKVVLWVSRQHTHTKARLKTMQKIVNEMNLVNCQHRCQFFMSNDENLVIESHVVIFFMFTRGYNLAELPSKRRAEQLWVAYIMEPPPLMQFKNPLRNVFNWTMSYRSDSDVVNSYGKTLLLSTPSNESVPLVVGNMLLDEWIMRKSKLVAGVISNCHTLSNRESLIKQLNSTGLGVVNIFGSCGHSQTKCQRYASNCTDFWQDLARQFRFYLAFENSLCTDYITEKFWRSLNLGMVPVVFGGGNYVREAPPKSFIDVRDFTSATELMMYLNVLAENPDQYAKYFEWRRKYNITFSGWNWCSLCDAVSHHRKYENSPLLSKNVYDNLDWWWQHQPNSSAMTCKIKPSSSNIFNAFMS